MLTNLFNNLKINSMTEFNSKIKKNSRILKIFMFFESNYILNIVVAMLKYTIMEQVSTNVVINGEAINAGSRPIFLANSGRVQPMIFERVTVTINDRAITIASPEL